MQTHCCGDDVTGSPASGRTIGVAALRPWLNLLPFHGFSLSTEGLMLFWYNTKSSHQEVRRIDRTPVCYARFHAKSVSRQAPYESCGFLRQVGSGTWKSQAVVSVARCWEKGALLQWLTQWCMGPEKTAKTGLEDNRNIDIKISIINAGGFQPLYALVEFSCSMCKNASEHQMLNLAVLKIKQT